ALAESGYDGTPIAIMAPGDVTTLKAQPVVAAQLLRQAGFKVDLQATDWQTVVSRRASQKPVSEGGWNMFFTNWVAADVMNPLVNFSIGGRGKNGGWFGWAEDAKIEKLKDQFARAGSPDEQKKIATEIQQEAYDQVIYIPLGQYLQPSAWRKSITGVLDGPATPIFWNVEKTEKFGRFKSRRVKHARPWTCVFSFGFALVGPPSVGWPPLWFISRNSSV